MASFFFPRGPNPRALVEGGRGEGERAVKRRHRRSGNASLAGVFLVKRVTAGWTRFLAVDGQQAARSRCLGVRLAPRRSPGPASEAGVERYTTYRLGGCVIRPQPA